MKVTLQQKILGGVMVIGLCLVGADQLGWLPGSSKAAADPATAAVDPSAYAIPEKPAAPAAVASARPAAAAAPVPTVAATSSLAQRLRNAAPAANAQAKLRDAFTPCAAWLGSPAAPVLSDNSIDQFRHGHRLTGVLSDSGRGAHAMVDGRIVPVGQSLDGFRLMAVSHRTATFESPEGQVTLTMTERSGTAGGGRVANVLP